MAFDEAKVKLIIEASTEAAAKKMREFSTNADQGLKNADVSARKFGDGLKQGWAKAKSAWVEIGAAVIALKKAYDLMNTAAQFKQRETAFRNMAASHGADADRIIADMKRLSAGTIDTMTIMEKAGTAMTLGIQADKLAELMEVARASSKITGQTVSQAYSDITLAVGRGSRMILDNLGIIVKVEEANEKYAQQLGKTSASLTEAEKKQAFLNATLEAGKDIVDRVGDSQDSAAEKIQRYQARWKDAAITIGKVLLNVAQGIEFVFYTVWTGISTIIEKVTLVVGKLIDKLSKVPLYGKYFKSLADGLKSVEENAKMAKEFGIEEMSKTWDFMTSMWKKEEPTRRKVVQDIEDQGKAAKKSSDNIKKLIDIQKAEADTRANAIAEMYNDMGLGADAYYREEVNKLAKKARDWQDAGVSIEDTNKYLYSKINALQEQALNKGESMQADWLLVMKNHTQELVNDLREKEENAASEIDKIAAKIDGLDGSEIAIDVRLFDNGATNVLDAIENKLKTLGVINNINVSSGAVSRLDDLQERIDGIHGNDVAFDVTAETDAALGKISEVETRINEIRGRGAEIAVNISDNTGDAVSRLNDLQERIDGIRGADVAFDVSAETDVALGKISEVETRINEIRGRGAEVDIIVTDNAAEVFAKIAELQAQSAEMTGTYTANLINNMQTREAQLSQMFGGISAGVAQLNANPINIQARLMDNGLTSGLDRIISKLRTVQQLASSTGMGAGMSVESMDLAGIEEGIARSIKYGESAMVSAI